MSNTHYIRQIIDGCVSSGIDKFVIYPYGKEGRMVSSILTEEYGIVPIRIVDNYLCLSDARIVSEKELLDEVRDDWVILVSTATLDVSERIISSLKNSVSPNNLKLLCGECVRTDSLELESLFCARNSMDKRSLFKIRVLYNSYSTWNSIRSIVEECYLRKEIDLLVIVGTANNSYSKEKLYDKQFAQMEEVGCRFVDCREYDIASDVPDVLLLSHLYEEIQLGSPDVVRDACKKIVVASSFLINYEYSTNSMIEQIDHVYSELQPDLFFFDSMVYDELHCNSSFRYNCSEMSNAKYDGIYKSMSNSERIRSNVKWAKMKDRKVFLWIVDHGFFGVNNDCSLSVCDDFTFDLFGKPLIEYVLDKEDIGLIIRPHPSFIRDMYECGLWTDEIFGLITSGFASTDNIILDLSDTYNDAIAISDGILIDSKCGAVFSVLPTMKPICLISRPLMSLKSNYEKAIVDSLYYANSMNGIIGFFDMILNDKDQKKSDRAEVSRTIVKHFDGRNGERIVDAILELLMYDK